jgi:hypothetical protein
MTEDELEKIATFVRTEAAFWSAWLWVEMFHEAIENMKEDLA